jgi:hypothetical protein
MNQLKATGQTATSEHSTGELVKLVTEQVSVLVRDELKLAQLEMSGKAKQAGKGAGMLGGGGLVALMTASQQPDDAQQLREEIERTREHLGETVEQLAAKVDVKARAQARAAELTDEVRQATAQGASAARKHSGPLSVAAAVILAVLGLIIWRRRRR